MEAKLPDSNGIASSVDSCPVCGDVSGSRLVKFKKLAYDGSVIIKQCSVCGFRDAQTDRHITKEQMYDELGWSTTDGMHGISMRMDLPHMVKVRISEWIANRGIKINDKWSAMLHRESRDVGMDNG